MLQQQKMAKSSSNEEALKNRRIKLHIYKCQKLNSNYKDKDHLINIANDESADDFIKWFYFHFFGGY